MPRSIAVGLVLWVCAPLLGCLTGGQRVVPAQAKTASAPSSSAHPALPTTAHKPAVILGYSASWTDALNPPAAYDYSGLTHIARSFIAPHADGHLSTGSDYWNEELERGAHAHGVKLLASIGGAAENANEWLGMARDAAAKERFFSEIDALISAHHYDGVDIDWEPSALTAADQQAYTSFMVSLRQRFPNWQISTALVASDWWARHISWQEIAASVDFINLMAYTFAGPWSGHSAHNANLYPAGSYTPDGVDVDSMVQGLIQRYHVAPSKIVLGLAFYGTQYSTDKLGQPFPANARYRGEELGYAQIARLAAAPGYQTLWDDGAQVPYLVRARGGHTLSFDDARAINQKCAYAAQNQLGGVMFWYLGGDRVRGVPVLQRAVERTYGLPSPEPSLDFLRASHAAELAEVERLSTELARELHDLESADPARRAAFSELQVEPAPLPASADRAALDAALLDADHALGLLELRRADVQRALAAAPPAKGHALAFTGATLRVADFEGQGLGQPLGGNWSASFDKNLLGTTFNPQPTAWANGGHESAHALHVWGHFGKSRAPWPFAALVADFEPTDFSPVQSMRLWVKGNGKRYSAALHRAAVHDYAFPAATFAVSNAWTQIELPLSDFKQPNWGAKVEVSSSDVTAIAFQPAAEFDDEDYDLWVDDVELVKR